MQPLQWSGRPRRHGRIRFSLSHTPSLPTSSPSLSIFSSCYLNSLSFTHTYLSSSSFLSLAAALPFIHYFSIPSWKLMVRQTVPFNFTPGVTDVHTDRPGAPNYSILSSLESMRKDGSFELKIRWPEYNECNEWEQTSNPLTSTTVTGYKVLCVCMRVCVCVCVRVLNL